MGQIGKCNDLITEQNTHIRDLARSVNGLKETNQSELYHVRETVRNATQEMYKIAQESKQFNSETRQSIRQITAETANELKDYLRSQVDETLQATRTELKELETEIENQRENLVIEGKFRRFMFWMTPVLLLAQTVISIYLLLK